jgi:23S rRNA (uracil1939-C5)-methyltransferase
VLVGFHERKSSYVADMQSCAVLPPRVSALLMPLRALVLAMDQRDRLPQIELAAGETVTALVLRHLEPLTTADLDRLRGFGAEHGVQWWLQPKGPDSAQPLAGEAQAELAYALPEFDLEMPFRPTDFTQVNPQINQALVGRALRLLDTQRDERVIDWFCGLGNFTLPIATRARAVLGVEGSEVLVGRARANALRAQARHPGLAARAEFAVRNLFEITPAQMQADGNVDKWLVDPPREGAFALAKALADLCAAGTAEPAWQPPRRIVYVSCNPATLARDAGLLVHQAGYVCSAAGAVNMFPHTAHVESLAVFDRQASA